MSPPSHMLRVSAISVVVHAAPPVSPCLIPWMLVASVCERTLMDPTEEATPTGSPKNTDWSTAQDVNKRVQNKKKKSVTVCSCTSIERFRRCSQACPTEVSDGGVTKAEKITPKAGASSFKDVRRGFFWSQKMHHSVTTKSLLPDMHVRRVTIVHRKLPMLTDIVLYACSEALKSGWIVDGFFRVTAELQRMPSDTSASI